MTMARTSFALLLALGAALPRGTALPWPVATKQSLRGTASCMRQADCPVGQYCDENNDCYDCGYLNGPKANCDAVSGCCSADFLEQCTNNPKKCQGNACASALETTCGADRRDVFACAQCSGVHQQQLQADGCDNDAIAAWCAGVPAKPEKECPACMQGPDGRCGTNSCAVSEEPWNSVTVACGVSATDDPWENPFCELTVGGTTECPTMRCNADATSECAEAIHAWASAYRSCPNAGTMECRSDPNYIVSQQASANCPLPAPAQVQWYSGAGSGWKAGDHSPTGRAAACSMYDVCDPAYAFDGETTGTSEELFGKSFDMDGPNYREAPWVFTIDVGEPRTFTHWRVAGSSWYCFGAAHLSYWDEASQMMIRIPQSDVLFKPDGPTRPAVVGPFVSAAFSAAVTSSRWQVELEDHTNPDNQARFQIYLSEVQFGNNNAH
jgi:hypothetical protein